MPQSFLTQSSSSGNQYDTQSQNSGQLSNLTQADLFAPGQQALQGQLADFGSNMLNGVVPQGLGLPKEVLDYSMQQWNQNVLPQLAAQYGAGSPAIGARYNEFLQGLAAESSRMSMHNANRVFDVAANFAMSPIGQTRSTSNSNSSSSTANRMFSNEDRGMDIGDLAQTSMGALASLFSY